MSFLVLTLLIAGPALLVAEAHLPTYGGLGAAGVLALVAGLVLATLDAGGSLLLGLALAAPVAVVGGGLGYVAVVKSREAGRLRARGGAEGLVGHVGVVRLPLDPLGQVAVDGELWRARRSWAEEDEPPPGRGEAVVVERVVGLTLSVRRAETWEVEK